MDAVEEQTTVGTRRLGGTRDRHVPLPSPGVRGGEDGRDPALPRPLRVPRAVNVLGLVLCAVLAATLPPMSVVAMLAVFLVGVGGRAFVLAGRGRPGR